MHELKVFANEEFGQIRTTVDEKGNVLFCGSDVAKALGYAKPGNAITLHCKGCTLKQGIPHPQNKNKTIDMIFIPEPDVYRLITKSKLPSAERFEKWVFEDVLPTIRKYGAYMTDEVLINAIRNPENLDILVEELAKDKKEKRAMKEKIGILEPKGVYFDNLVFLGVLTSIRDTANELKIKPMRFTQFLLDNKYVYRKKNQRIFPYQQYVHCELFEIKDFYCNGFHCEQTCITIKGKLYFLELLKEKEII